MEVLEEITPQNSIKGFEGTVIEISDNKQNLRLRLFGHFEEVLDIHNVSKIN